MRVQATRCRGRDRPREQRLRANTGRPIRRTSRFGRRRHHGRTRSAARLGLLRQRAGFPARTVARLDDRRFAAPRLAGASDSRRRRRLPARQPVGVRRRARRYGNGASGHRRDERHAIRRSSRWKPRIQLWAADARPRAVRQAEFPLLAANVYAVDGQPAVFAVGDLHAARRQGRDRRRDHARRRWCGTATISPGGWSFATSFRKCEPRSATRATPAPPW